MKQVERAFDAAASVLRSVLRLPNGESLLETIPGGLLLPGQHQVWVDADQFESLLNQGLWADDPQESMLLLQEAHRLLRGEFLEDDLYQDWATARREMLYGKMGECVYALTDLYTKQQRPDLARAVLWEFLMMFPTDMDALYRLMALLEQQGREHAAWRLYKQAKETAAQDGFSLPPRIHTLAKRIKDRLASSEMNLTVPAATPVPLPATAKVLPETLIPALVQADGANSGFPLVSQAIAQGIIQAVRELGIQDMDEMRRLFLQQALGVTSAVLITPSRISLTLDMVERLSRTLAKPSTVDEATLRYLQVCTANYWRDRHGAALASCDLYSYVSNHFLKVVTLLEGSLLPTVRERLCVIASETAQLIGELLFDMHDSESERIFKKAAIIAAQEAHNPVLEAVAWGRMSFAWTYSGNLLDARICIQEAHRLATDRANSTVRAWLAAVEAEIQGMLSDRDACLALLANAACLEENQQSDDEDSYWLSFDRSLLAGYQGVCFQRLSSVAAAQRIFFLREAQQALKDALARLNPALKQRQPTLVIDLAGTYVQQQEIEEACNRAVQAVTMTLQMKSQINGQRLLEVRQKLEPWKDAYVVKQLDEQMAPLLIPGWHRGQVAV